MNARTMKTLVSLACAALVLALPLRVQAQGAIGTVVTLTGYFLNAASLTPVEANYAVYDSQGKKVGQSFRSSATDGYLQTGLKAGQTYTIRVEDPRYFRQEFAIDLPATSKYLELSKDFVVRPMEAGRKIKVTPVPFDVKKSALKTGAEDDLADLVRVLTMNPGANIEIVCYPDAEGTADASQKISQARAEALKAHFASKGVSAARISIKAVTTVDPLDPPPIRPTAKGKRYVGPVYLVITKV
ncbi:MAG: hypothetical protein RLZZ150_1276 [Bacteroidota bacterium]